jgi:hypothetical protein
MVRISYGNVVTIFQLCVLATFSALLPEYVLAFK